MNVRTLYLEINCKAIRFPGIRNKSGGFLHLSDSLPDFKLSGVFNRTGRGSWRRRVGGWPGWSGILCPVDDDLGINARSTGVGNIRLLFGGW